MTYVSTYTWPLTYLSDLNYDALAVEMRVERRGKGKKKEKELIWGEYERIVGGKDRREDDRRRN